MASLPRSLLALSVALLALYGLLMVPEPTWSPTVEPTGRTSFRWDADAFFQSLQARFEGARAAGCTAATPEIEIGLATLRARIAELRTPQLHTAIFEELEAELFALAPLVAACPAALPELSALIAQLRAGVKRLSETWDLKDSAVRDRLYRLLYGSRAALEEALLQAPDGVLPAVQPGTAESSAAPSTELLGLRIHSGDLLVSRGGAPTSALIARGNDYPGNFSHVAVVHVGEDGTASVIEAHIESGVAVATAAEYLADKKLRVLVLRVRADHRLMRWDPLLPHRAATAALLRARSEHVPYDFAMDFQDPSRLFCSEVASSVYADQGLTLWMEMSHMSSPVLRSWLGGFGVRHFATQAPSDLEYDPSLRVVAEWRDHEVLLRDHIDNAVIDALLELAQPGEPLPYPALQLPVYRLVKAYSVLINWLGSVGPVPEGMSATAALRNQAFSARHARLMRLVWKAAEERPYTPPYWELVKMAEAVVARNDP